MLLTRSRPTDVLLVDDDEDVLESYCHLLNLSGYKPRGLADPEQALALLDDQWPGVLVSDIYMPAMNGLDLLAQVQRIDAEIPVILITGHGDIPLAVRAVKQGAFDFLEKPLHPEALLDDGDLLLVTRSAVNLVTTTAGREGSPGKGSTGHHLPQKERPLASLLCT